jgi:LacI family transcriptional regulator
VPDDLSMIGFDNVPESALSEPPLTTIEQPIKQMGFDAVKILIRLIDGTEPVPEHTLLPTRLIVRGSCRRLEGGR